LEILVIDFHLQQIIVISEFKKKMERKIS